MQPSEFEIRREVETLRDIRRRSSVQGSTIDPDLPTVASDSSSSSTYWEDSSSSSHSHESDNSTVAGDDPLNLFWVPARLHPEIAPAEFRQFLKEHARNPSDGAALERSSSMGSTGLGRKKSMLSRQYNPEEKDGVEEENVVPIRRNRSSMYRNQGPQLTINDLQKLEQLAEEASESSDPSKLRSILRRSMSLNISPSVIDQMDDIPEQGDEADVPIIVPRPGQILRRAARTKIRKAGTGEGPHRFSSTRARRGSAGRTGSLPPGRTSDDLSSSDHGDEAPRRKRADSDVPELTFSTRPDSFSEEHSIYDAYARDDSDESESHAPLLVTSPETPEFQPVSPQPPELSEPTLHHPQPQRVLSPPLPETDVFQPRSPSPEVPPVPPVPAIPPLVERQQPPRPSLSHQGVPYQPPPPTSPSPSDQHRKEKDKKGLFGKWGGDKASKKGHNHHREKEKEKEKDSGFFGSLFGGGKKTRDDAATPPIGGLGNAGREAAAALLGSSKSAKAYVPSPSPQPIQGYARYPIHVERAIYRLSHIKLANPRRPLYEQVLISNLMFWYLGVINKSPTPNGSATPNATGANGAKAEGEKSDQAERESNEKEEREKAERERLEKEREREREREKEREKSVESKRKGSLTKTPTPGTPGARRAETPVRGPQYDMQHRAMEQEYGYPGVVQPMPRTSSSAPPPMNFPPQRTGSPGQYSSVQLVQPQPQVAQNRYYNPANSPVVLGQPYPMNQQPGAMQLPPGAMPPVAVEQAWVGPGSPTPGRTASPPRVVSPPSSQIRTSPPSVQRHSPHQDMMQGVHGKTPGRSLSASATAPAPHRQTNGAGLGRKGNSAHAVMPNFRTSEEEDVPLAVYQQRRK
ncbi:hypothetical protein BDY19DRAFT_998235 [Irpex rosettiformis]|uniref:Uncharacterized protein n=1 Tax=Irpex rosettiformis TaxID=378272 RepID=A0ACB8TP81_9APHY|nr:hypothetical protein BDY19DRAFT_998235 [Irpex rosettiformis]